MITFSEQRVLALCTIFFGLVALVGELAFSLSRGDDGGGLNVLSILFSLLVVWFGAVLLVEAQRGRGERMRLGWLLAAMATGIAISLLRSPGALSGLL